MGLTDHFSVRELSYSDKAIELGIDNMPPNSLMPNLFVLAVGLEQVRKVAEGHPIHINCAYRCQQVNEAVGGAKDSAHLGGFAADITCSFYGTPLELCHAIMASGIRFDQLIYEGTWVHISFAPAMRQEVLTAHPIPNSKKKTYTRGLP